MNSQTFILLVALAFVVIIIAALKQHLKYKDEREQEEAQMRAYAAQRAREKREEQDEPLEIEIVGRDVYEEKMRRATAGLYGGKRSNRYYGGFGLNGFDADDTDLLDDVDLPGDADLPDDIDLPDDHDSMNEFDLDGDFDEEEWDRDAAILAAQQNLRLMREEDLNYAMDDIEAQILNMDHAPTEDELIGIADSAADFYDMSEDYQDY